MERFLKMMVLLLIIIFTNNLKAQTITQNEIGEQGGYTYEFWKDDGGTGSMALGEGGTFSCEWDNINNILFRKGLRPGSYDQIVEYSVVYNPSGNSYLTVYGWTTDPLVEFYIVESWGTWRPPGASSIGTVVSDGGTYDIYETLRENQPSIIGTATFSQYWSVRTNKRTSGTIHCENHFDAWVSLGLNMSGDFYEVSFCVEGYQSNGNAEVTGMTMTAGSGGDNGDNGEESRSMYDFENFDINHTFSTMGWGGQEAVVVNDPVNPEAGNNVLEFTFTNYNAAPVLEFTLDEGLSLADYSSFTFKGYFADGDVGWKWISVIADNNPLSGAFYPSDHVDADSRIIGTMNRAVGESTEWENISIPIEDSEDINLDDLTGTIYVAFGINGEDGTWYADDVGFAAEWTGGTDSDWATASNWSPEAVPTAGMNIIIPPASNNPEISDARNINYLKIEDGSSLTIGSNGKLTVNDALVNNYGTSGLIINSDASATGSLIHNSSNIEATVERYMQSSNWSSAITGWHFLSSPVINQNIDNNWTPEGEDNDYDLFAYQENPPMWLNQKVVANNINVFIPGKGYLVSYQQEDTKEFTGELNVNEINIQLSSSGDDTEYGWNLIGNPYASAIQWRDEYAGKLEQNAVYIYANDNYLVVDNNDIIPAHQGFFVKVKSENHGGDFTFTNNMRTHAGSFMKKSEKPDMLTLILSLDQNSDETTIRLNDNSCFNRDRNDALKLFSLNEKMPQIFSYSGDQKKLVVNSLPYLCTEKNINIGMKLPVDAEYNLSVGKLEGRFSETPLYLIDLKTAKAIDLRESSIYTFDAEKGDLNDRFEISFGKQGDVVGISEHAESGLGKVWYYNSLLQIETKEDIQVELFDIFGRQLQSLSVTEGIQSFSMELSAGVYIIYMTNQKITQSKQIIVK